MDLVIIKDDGYVQVNGYGIKGMNLALVTPDIHAIQFHGSEGWIEYNDGKPPKAIVDVEQYRDIINEHDRLRVFYAERKADPYYGMSDEEKAAKIELDQKVKLQTDREKQIAEGVLVDGVLYSSTLSMQIAYIIFYLRAQNDPYFEVENWRIREGEEEVATMTKALVLQILEALSFTYSLSFNEQKNKEDELKDHLSKGNLTEAKALAFNLSSALQRAATPIK